MVQSWGPKSLISLKGSTQTTRAISMQPPEAVLNDSEMTRLVEFVGRLSKPQKLAPDLPPGVLYPERDGRNEVRRY